MAGYIPKEPPIFFSGFDLHVWPGKDLDSMLHAFILGASIGFQVYKFFSTFFTIKQKIFIQQLFFQKRPGGRLWASYVHACPII